MILRGGLDDLAVVAHAILASVELAAVEIVVDISGLDHVHSEALIEGESAVELRLVVAGSTGGLVVAYQTHALAAGIGGDLGDVEIGIGFSKRELAAVGGPVAVPAFVPAFDENARIAVFSGKVDISLGVLGRCAMLGARRPCPVLHMHSPPDSDIAARLDPRRIFDLAGIGKIQRQSRQGEIAGRCRHGDSAPGGSQRERCEHLLACRPWSQAAVEGCRGRIGAEVHLGVVDDIRLVDRQVEVVGNLHRQRGRHCVETAQGRRLVEILIVFGTCGLRPCHGVFADPELGVFIENRDGIERCLPRYLVAESETVVKQSEHQRIILHIRPVFGQIDTHLVVVVAHLRLFAPGQTPGFVESRMAHRGYL